MFKSKSLSIHLLRGLSGFALIVAALTGRLPAWAIIVSSVTGIVLLRGCPMCWAVGLIETLFDKAGTPRPTRSYLPFAKADPASTSTRARPADFIR